MNRKLYSARAWCLLLMVGATSVCVGMDRVLPPEWWVLLGIVVRDYFGRNDRTTETGA
jgi:hypothetical protein